MKIYKSIFKILCFTIVFVGFNNTAKSKTNNVNNEVSVDSTGIDEINKLIDAIESKSKTVKPRVYENPIIVGLYTCSITDFGQKKQILCFDGGMQEREILAYYGDDKILKTAIFTTIIHNASPANLAEFDQSKSFTIDDKLIFKKHNDPMYTGEIESVFNENNEKIKLTESLKTQWNSFTAAVPPY